MKAAWPQLLNGVNGWRDDGERLDVTEEAGMGSLPPDDVSCLSGVGMPRILLARLRAGRAFVLPWQKKKKLYLCLLALCLFTAVALCCKKKKKKMQTEIWLLCSLA